MISIFENHFLAGELTFGHPFQDCGVVGCITRPLIGERDFFIDNLLVRIHLII